MAVEGAILDLLAAVPLEYGNAAFLDLRQILGSDALSASVDRLGVLAALGPAADQLKDGVDAILMARGPGGVLGVLKGDVDPRRVAEAIGSPGSRIESEGHGEFEVISAHMETPFFSLVVAVSRVDEATALFAVGPSLEGSSGLAKASLDTAAGAAPGLSGDPAIGKLLLDLPAGFALTLDPRCGLLPEVEGCIGAGVSATLQGEQGVVHGVFMFREPAAALAALPVIVESAGRIGGISSLSEVRSDVDGSVVRIEAVVGLEGALEWAIGQTGA
ncbi:MAG: hypothetical protein J4F43_07825 [Dehalococcoidia bacterium]|nr:hypothetical protein [Dehalococcoidia bacterium]